MPEGPEIRFLVELIRKIVTNNVLVNIVALSKRKVRLPHRLKVNNIQVKGKLMWLDCGEYFVHIHMGLSGWITLVEPEYTKYILEFKDTKKIYIDDPRKFSKITIYKKVMHDKKINSLGIDILTNSFTYESFKDKINKSHKMLSSFLLDQSNFSGIGNYIKNESLYIGKINPKRTTNSLSNLEILKLFEAITYVSYSILLEELYDENFNINNSNLSDIKRNKPGRVQIPYKYRVYNKENDPYGNKITLEIIGGRKTFYVKKLQK